MCTNPPNNSPTRMSEITLTSIGQPCTSNYECISSTCILMNGSFVCAPLRNGKPADIDSSCASKYS